MEFLRDLWLLLRPYWTSKERWISWAFLIGIFALVVTGVKISVLMNAWNADFYNALQRRDLDTFLTQMAVWAMIFAASLSAAIAQAYLRRILQLRWRSWMTESFMANWMGQRAYYHLQLTATGTDNPDQRIAEDIDQFCSRTINLLFDFLSAVLKLFAFVVILWGVSGSFTVGGVVIPGYMFWIVLVYATCANWLAHIIGRALMGLNFRHEKYEANFRYSLVRVRENAQGIALYSGETEELRTLGLRFGDVVHNIRDIIRRETMLGAFVSAHAQINAVIAYLIAAPQFFAGSITLGTLMQSASAFIQTEVALSWLVRSYRSIAEWRATVDRLRGFRFVLDKKETETMSANERRAETSSFSRSPSSDQTLRAENIILRLPDGKTLVEKIDLAFPPGTRTLLTGPSGCGKSTLLNAIAGLWPFGSGAISVPPEARLLFLPQKAYLPVANLRRAVTYPDAAENHSDREVVEALMSCGLSFLTERLDEEQDWSQRLSPGEQQRLAFARALLIRPDFLFLDEATSALDEKSEAVLYRLLLAELPETAIVSIAHRSTVSAFHRHHVAIADQTELSAVS